MNALVTGGAGFIGSHLVDALLAGGHSVRVLDDLSTGDERYLNPAADFLCGEVADPRVARQAAEGVDVVFHQAAHRAILRSVDQPLATDTANVHGTLAILDAAVRAGVRRVVAASSSSVYGGTGPVPAPESAPTHPRSPYAVTKLAGEHYCRVWWELHGLETVSLRYFNVYGPRQRADAPYAAVVPLFLDALTRGTRPVLHGDGLQSRDFTYVDDAVAANVAAATASAEQCSGRAYNVAGGRSWTLVEVLGMLGRLLDVIPEPVHTDARPGDVRHTCAAIGAARRDLGHMPAVELEEGLRRTAAWFVGQDAAHAVEAPAGGQP